MQKQDLFKKSVRKIEIPEVGEFYFRSPSLREIKEVQENATDEVETILRLVALTLVDADAVPLFANFQELNELSVDMLAKVSKVVKELLYIPTKVEEAKNS